MTKNYKYYFEKSGEKVNNNLDLPKTILTKPFIKWNNINSVPEIVILKLLCKKFNLDGFWVDTFHKKIRYTLDNYRNINDFPAEIKNKIEKIKKKNNNKISGCWDLILYDKSGNIKFVEIKGIPSKDKIRKTQLNWYNQCKKTGFNDKNFIRVEWDFKKGDEK